MKTFIASIAIAIVYASNSRAQASHPNFSGKWVLDAQRSEQSPVTPSALDYTIDQTGDRLVLTRSTSTAGGDSKATMTMGVDGKPWKNEWKQGGMDAKGVSTLAWDGATLVIKTAVEFGGQSLQQTDRWSLDADGKIFTINRSVDFAGQQASGKIVLTRTP